jgi:hypothetical protein
VEYGGCRFAPAQGLEDTVYQLDSPEFLLMISRLNLRIIIVLIPNDGPEYWKNITVVGKTPGFAPFISEKSKFVDEDECGELVEFTDKAKPKNLEKQAKIKKKKFEGTFLNDS